MHLVLFQETTNDLSLSDDDRRQYDRQYRPDNDKDPYVDLLIGDSNHTRPVDQYIHTPVEYSIHHVPPPWFDMVLLMDQIL
jgi:hypothetical protein